MWDAEKPKLAIVMLAPSTAAAVELDTTTQLVLNNAARLGYGPVSIVNLFATLNDFSMKCAEPEDPENMDAIVKAAGEDDMVIYAPGVDDKKNYDLSFYPIPRADSVPDELREIVNDPIFMAEELTLETVYCRAHKVDDAGDTDGWRMRFSVKYGDVIVSVSSKGVDPEWVYQQVVNLITE